MSWLNRITSTASRAASNVLSGPRRLASNVIPESVQRRVTDFCNWINGYVGSEQISRVLNEIVDHVRTNYPPRQSFEVRESNSALRNFARVYTIDGIEGYDARSFLDGARENMTSVLRNNRRTKVKLIFKCNMERPSTLGETVIKPADFHSDIEVNLDGTDEIELYDTMAERIIEKMATFQSMGSGWRLYSITQLELHTVRYNPLRGETWIPLPKELANKKAIINMQNKDNKCFLWCVLRALDPKAGHPERLDKELKTKENTLNMEGIDYPVRSKDLKKFEKQNPSISITVFGYEGKSVYPLRNSANTGRDYDIILMLIEHYCLVKSIERLLSSQVSKGKRKEYFCLNCFNPFPSEKSLNKHKEYCNYHKAVKIKLPEEGTMLKFKNYYRREKVPFIVYADFECFIEQIQSCDSDDKEIYTKQYQKHEPSSFCYYIKCFDDKVYKPKIVSYTGEDAAQKFVEMLEKDIKEITSIPEKEMIFNVQEQKQYEKETECWICNEKFDEIDKSETIVILLVGMEEPRITRVILTIKNLILRP